MTMIVLRKKQADGGIETADMSTQQECILMGEGFWVTDKFTISKGVKGDTLVPVGPRLSSCLFHRVYFTVHLLNSDLFV